MLRGKALGSMQIIVCFNAIENSFFFSFFFLLVVFCSYVILSEAEKSLQKLKNDDSRGDGAFSFENNIQF